MLSVPDYLPSAKLPAIIPSFFSCYCFFLKKENQGTPFFDDDGPKVTLYSSMRAGSTSV